MIFNPGIERLPIPALRKVQNERLQNLVLTVYTKVPFYRRKFDEQGINPGTIRGVEDLYKLPITRKKDLRDHYPFQLLAVPETRLSRIHCSSGTTGKPTVVGYTANDIGIFAEVVARSLAASGCKPGMKLQNAFGYGLFTGGLGLHYGAEKLGMAVIPISGGGTDKQILLLKDFRPEAICATPSYAQVLAEEIANRGIEPGELNLQHAILGAEPWTEIIRGQVEKGLNAVAVNIYGLSEIIGPGVSCEDYEEKGTGSYIWEDHFFPEILDRDSGEPLPEGKTGVLVLTTLSKEAMPLIRYWTNDITNIYYEKSSKRTHIKMGPILGRSDDMLIIRGVNFFHTQVEDLLKGISHLNPYYEVIVSKVGPLDEAELKIEVDDGFLKDLGLSNITEQSVKECDGLFHLKSTLEKKIKDNIGLSMRVVLCNAGQLPRSQGGKTSRIRDLR